MNLKAKKIIFPFVGDSIGGSQISTIELIKILKKKKLKLMCLFTLTVRYTII